ncbi:MAG: iron-sulfur cluster repair di-iron protein [Planctomycetes bacterium]|nr:iron-sulfur cluster repair di-iron protein [Planctomycetota bacterium]MBL7008312.1 iron-sulfur cluster repair di-iron protein [Planctomycetota bacterium]
MPTSFTLATPIGDIAVALPPSIGVFERLGMDYCCGGSRTLAESAKAADADAEAVLAELAGMQRSEDDRDWSEAPIPELLDHILSSHHEYTKQALPALWEMIRKVVNAHGERHPELEQMRRIMGGLFQELDMHLQKEEQILFPMIRALAEPGAGGAGPGGCPSGPEGPMTVMEAEHDSAGAALRELRSLSAGYVLPEGACTTYQALFAGMQDLEKDLHTHIHLENNVLHPRTRALMGL